MPGRPMFFATALPLGGAGRGVRVESHEGRPTKVHGNPPHPGSLGATDVFAEAAVLDLFDPTRDLARLRGGARRRAASGRPGGAAADGARGLSDAGAPDPRPAGTAARACPARDGGARGRARHELRRRGAARAAGPRSGGHDRHAGLRLPGREAGPDRGHAGLLARPSGAPRRHPDARLRARADAHRRRPTAAPTRPDPSCPSSRSGPPAAARGRCPSACDGPRRPRCTTSRQARRRCSPAPTRRSRRPAA